MVSITNSQSVILEIKVPQPINKPCVKRVPHANKFEKCLSKPSSAGFLMVRLNVICKPWMGRM